VSEAAPHDPAADRLLADRLLAASEELTEQVIGDMYRDPFWFDRFGAPRADRHGRQDGNHHVAYLAEALRAVDPLVMERYARWLQQVLTTRGMCSRHLAENFERLGRAIAERGWPHHARAVELLEAAVDALRYEGGPARAVQDRVGAIAGDDDELATFASYLSDALALGRPPLFAAHAAWYAGFAERRDRPAATVEGLLARLREGALRELPEHRATIEHVLHAAHEAVRDRR
jgi:hypothetical protein